MSQQMQFIGFTYEQAQHFIHTIVKACLEENTISIKNTSEAPVTTKQACEILGVSAPTLRKFVALSLIRRHDLGPRKKVFYRSELEEDIKRIRAARSFKNEE
jgi:excisionase family DNA binding protein